MRSKAVLVLLAVLTCSLLVLSQLFLKHAIEGAGTTGGLVRLLGALVRVYAFWVAVASTASASVVWLILLRRSPVSVAYPLLSLSYVLMVPAARLTFREPVTFSKVTGSAIICLGVLIVARSGR
jgi:drug/metabolite transporter (DMT)-like permease